MELISEATREETLENLNTTDEQSLEQRYNERVAELVKKGYTPRKARRYIDSEARRAAKKFMKNKR